MFSVRYNPCVHMGILALLVIPVSIIPFCYILMGISHVYASSLFEDFFLVEFMFEDLNIL